MSTTAHSDFFGLDLSFNAPSTYTISPEAWTQAQENLSQWNNLNQDITLYPSETSTTNLPQQQAPKLPQAQQIKTQASLSTEYPPVDSVNPAPSSSQHTPSSSTSPSINTTHTPSHPSSSLYSPSKVTKPKHFHFVANSDKKTATRIRNTMTSRNLRQSKVSRIAQLEREIEGQRIEAEKWKERALVLGWTGEGES